MVPLYLLSMIPKERSRPDEQRQQSGSIHELSNLGRGAWPVCRAHRTVFNTPDRFLEFRRDCSTIMFQAPSMSHSETNIQKNQLISVTHER
jgi:hypothetical protein